MKKIIAVISFFCLGWLVFAGQVTISGGGQIFVGSVVHFQFNPSQGEGAVFRWDFGDGQVETKPGHENQHFFKEPGSFRVTCSLEGSPNPPVNGEIMVNVGDNRSIAPQGGGFRSGRKVNFQSENFVENNLRWDFGDGTVENGPRNHGHAYANPGNFTVRAFDFGGNTSTAITCQVVIEMDNRQVQATPLPARANHAINFSAANFSGSDLKWNFGDGKIENGGLAVFHVYTAAGNFQVQVWDAGDAPENALKTTVAVQPDIRQVGISGPAELFLGAEVVFESRNFAAGPLQWDFGDGVVERGGARQTHRYQRSGNFFLKVVEADEPHTLPFEKKIQVLNDNRDLVVKTAMIFADSEFEIEAQNFRGPAVSWDFGDGALVTGPRLMKHRYNRTGQFRIRAVDFAGRDGKFIEKIVLVESDSRFISLPDEIIAGEAIDMQLKNTPAGNFVWKFSDGETRSGQDLKGKAFRYPGPQKITVADATGKYPPLEKAIRVLPDTRVLKSSVGFSLPGEDVAFTAMNFKGPGIRWDFGDGTVKENGQARETHLFSTIGRFQVKAVDFNGGSSKVFSTDVVVAEMTPGFKINTLEFVFANGKYYRVITKNGPGPNYQLRVKTKGRGVLTGQFILDNMPIGLFQIIVQENQSGQLPRSQMVPLPALDPGLHELTVKFNNYTFNKQIPVIKYFVSTAGMIEIISPPIDSKIQAEGEIELRWRIDGKKPLFEIAISSIPFQFMNDKQIEWQPVSGTSFTFIPGSFKPGSWIYWQVRLLNESKQVQTTSEIASFKLSE
jgi:PKD repeat protein